MLQNFRLSLQIKKHPSKTKEQRYGIRISTTEKGKAFAFKTTHQGYHHDLGKRLKQIIPIQVDNDHIVFAIWKKSKRKKAA